MCPSPEGGRVGVGWWFKDFTGLVLLHIRSKHFENIS